MIAVPIAGDERQLAVCAPSFRDRFGVPSHPSELASFRCIGWRPAPKLRPYRWEFADGGKEFSVAVAPEITTNDTALMIKLAIAGAGITFGMEASFRPAIVRGELVPILEDYCPVFAGFYLYYPQRCAETTGAGRAFAEARMEHAMAREELAGIYRNYIACLNRQDWPALGRFVHGEVAHNARPLGLSGYRAMLERDFREIPDLHFDIELLIAEPPRIAARLKFDCAPAGTFLGLAVNGRRVRFCENVFYEFDDGKIRQVWSVIDKTAIEAQL
ncbi:Predicted ester cyclase [Bradyrhizobium sp. Ghvi]|nr:Predicted ester cyclase [Bradyrhizobium sp. Ghvi]